MSDSIAYIPQELLNLIRHGENYQIEYKESRTELPKSLFDTVSSFSNREGGDIFLGVNDNGVITGVDPKSAPIMKKISSRFQIIRTKYIRRYI